MINQAGWNKRAGRENFEAIKNKQGGKDQKHKGKPWKYNLELKFTLSTISFSQHSLILLQILIEI
jgi:hypothetical protein